MPDSSAHPRGDLFPGALAGCDIEIREVTELLAGQVTGEKAEITVESPWIIRENVPNEHNWPSSREGLCADYAQAREAKERYCRPGSVSSRIPYLAAFE